MVRKTKDDPCAFCDSPFISVCSFENRRARGCGRPFCGAHGCSHKIDWSYYGLCNPLFLKRKPSEEFEWKTKAICTECWSELQIRTLRIQSFFVKLSLAGLFLLIITLAFLFATSDTPLLECHSDSIRLPYLKTCQRRLGWSKISVPLFEKYLAFGEETFAFCSSSEDGDCPCRERPGINDPALYMDYEEITLYKNRATFQCKKKSTCQPYAQFKIRLGHCVDSPTPEQRCPPFSRWSDYFQSCYVDRCPANMMLEETGACRTISLYSHHVNFQTSFQQTQQTRGGYLRKPKFSIPSGGLIPCPPGGEFFDDFGYLQCPEDIHKYKNQPEAQCLVEEVAVAKILDCRPPCDPYFYFDMGLKTCRKRPCLSFGSTQFSLNQDGDCGLG